MENSKTEKSADTRKSGPELGGSNGALKALAKNVANQLKLDRPEMKRVVAKVVAERHGLGDVADHKGFMYYVKPDRIDMNQLISQSKEAFDGMMQQQRHRETLPQQQRKAPAKVGESRRTLSGGGANKKKKAVSRKSSTAVFQLQDWGRKSLNGVIIDQTHLPRGGKEILLSVNRRMVAMGAASSKKKKETKMPAAVPVRKPLRMQKFIAMKSSSSSRVPPLLKKSSVRKIPAKGANPRAPKVVDSSSSTLKGESYRLPAGSSFHPPPANPIESDTKKPLAGSKSKTSINPKQTVQCQRNYEKPWLVSRHKRHPRLKTEDGAAAAVGAIRAGRAGGAGGDAEGQSQSSGSKLPAHPSKRTQALNRPRTRANYLTPRGTGATKQKLKKAPSKYNVSKTGITCRPNPEPKGRNSKAKQIKQQPQAVTSPGGRKETNITSPQNRGGRVNKVIQDRLIKDLQRDEAIDEPERLEAGSTRRPSRSKKRTERKPKMVAQQQQKEEGETAAAVIEVRAGKVVQQNQTSKASKANLKGKPKDKPADKSVRSKRPPKVTTPSAKAASPKAANRKSATPKAASRKSATPKATHAVASPKKPSQPINPHPKTRYLLRTQCSSRVPVGSSLGSIGLLRLNKQNGVGGGGGAAAAAGGGTSTSILTPAKRNLTIAFMNKRLEERNQRTQVLVPWK